MMFRTVIFDLDGTLLDTLEDLAAAVDHALARRGFPLHTVEEYRGMVGHGVRNLVIRALPPERQTDERLVGACLADFKAYYSAHIDVHTRPYPGMPELVTRLHRAGIRLAIASNKFQEGTETLVGRFFPGIPFVAILGNREGYPLKPDPEIVREVLRASGVRQEEAVMVGDSPTDMKTAENGGIRAVAVGWGYRTMTPCGSYPVVSTPAELEMVLLGRFWRWHINFCPGWKNYFSHQDEQTKADLREKYHLEKYK